MGVYNVQTPGTVQDLTFGMIVVALVLVAAGTILIVRYRKKTERIGYPIIALMLGITLLLVGFVLYSPGSSTIVVRQGSISVSGQYIGNETYRASDIKTAFVENVYTGSLTLSSRDMGTELGGFNEGVYTLSNGAAAHVISANETDLIIELNSGLYLVLGTSNTNALVSDFAANVAPVTGTGT
jgi:hypothetical protein